MLRRATIDRLKAAVPDLGERAWGAYLAPVDAARPYATVRLTAARGDIAPTWSGVQIVEISILGDPTSFEPLDQIAQLVTDSLKDTEITDAATGRIYSLSWMAGATDFRDAERGLIGRQFPFEAATPYGIKTAQQAGIEVALVQGEEAVLRGSDKVLARIKDPDTVVGVNISLRDARFDAEAIQALAGGTPIVTPEGTDTRITGWEAPTTAAQQAHPTSTLSSTPPPTGLTARWWATASTLSRTAGRTSATRPSRTRAGECPNSASKVRRTPRPPAAPTARSSSALSRLS